MPISNKITYSNILVIKPAYHCKGGTAIAIFDEEARQLKACSLLFTSSPREQAKEVRKFWDTVGNKKHEPIILYVEYPHLRSTNKRDVPNHKILLMMGAMRGQIENMFSPLTNIYPNSGCRQLYLIDETFELNVTQKLDLMSNKILSDALDAAPTFCHQTVYDVVEMGLALGVRPNSGDNVRQQPNSLQCNAIQYRSVRFGLT